MRAPLCLALAFFTACSVPDFFLVDAGGGGDDGGGDDGGVDAKPDAVIDAPPGAATVTGVSSTATDGYYKAAATISIQVTFSAAVTVTGTPTLALNTGVTVNYASGSGTTTLTFTYTVATGNASADLDYTTTSALSVNGGTIKNGTNDAFLTLPAPGATGSLGANKALVIDAVTPTVSTIAGPSGYANSSSASLGYTVTETNLGTTSCTQTVGTGVMATCTPTGATFSSLTDGNHTIVITHTDAAGNVSAPQTISWTVDTVAPMLSTISGPAQFVQTATAALSWSLNETNQGTTTCTQTVGTGTMAGCGASGVSFTGLSEGLHTVTVVHTDLAGTPSTTRTFSWTVDLTNPSVSAISGPAPFEPSASGTLSYTLTEMNQSNTSCTFTVGTGTIDECTATSAVVSGLNEGAHTLQVTHTDLSGRTGSRTYSWTVDTVQPAFSNVAGPSGGWTATPSVTITYTINDANLSPTSTCNQIAGTATVTVCDNARATFTNLSPGKHTIVIEHIDKAGNPNGVEVQFSYCPPAIFTTPDIVAYIVPADCGTTMDIQVWGAGGGGGRFTGGIGGGAGYASGTLTNVIPTQGYLVRVGGGGSPSNTGAGGGGFNDGGSAGANAGGGGGWSGVEGPNGDVMRVAGGGGGGACGGAGNGGFGGGLNGQAGANGTSGITGGFGATTSSPGAGGVPGGLAGTGFGRGGGGADTSNGCSGGGGGGGRYGGGGGGGPTGTTGSGAGGGGGSTTIFATLTSPSNQSGSGPNPGGVGAPNYISGRGQGGAVGLPGGDGMVVLHVHP
jgi:hypothetical protein